MQPEKWSNWNFDEELKSLEESGCKLGMNCDKCHGWMEQRYHPQVYKKGKQNSTDMMQVLEKKLKKDKPSMSNRLSQVVEEKRLENCKGHIHSVGIPFFKKEVDNS